MPLRRAEVEDLRPLAELWCQAFPGERTVTERMRQLQDGAPYGGLQSAWIEEQDGRMVGAFKAYRMTQYLGGAPLPMMGLAAVAVAPAARRRGVGRELCRNALRLARDRGDLVSVLYPFRPAFYRSLGWGLAGEFHSYVFHPEALRGEGDPAGVRLAGRADRAGVAGCYARVAARSNGPILRDDATWSLHLDFPSVHPFVFEERGRIEGYLIARFGRARSFDARTLHVRELVAENDVAYRALLGWIASQRDQWRRIRYDARPDEHFGLRLADPRPPGYRPSRPLWDPTARILRGPMLRVLDVPAALAARPRWGEEPGVAFAIEVEVDDPELPENRGPWNVLLEEAGARVQPAEGGGGDTRLVTDASTFAQIYAGELLPSTAARLGRAEVQGAAAALDRVFGLSPGFWLADEF